MPPKIVERPNMAERPTILVVCDDERTCERVCAALDSLAHNVVVTGSEGALAALESHRPKLAVVRTASQRQDAEIIARLRAADPGLQILLISDLAA